MMSLSQIRDLSREEGAKAARRHRVPYMWAKEDDFNSLRMLPNLGDYRPDGWELVRRHFVDKSGFGAEDEPALTINQFLRVMKPGMGYAIIEEGEFQVYIGEFRPRRKMKKAA